MERSITLTPIGHVHSLVEETVDEKWGCMVSRIVLLPEYAGGLKFMHPRDRPVE